MAGPSEGSAAQAESLRDASDRLRGKQEKKGSFGKILFVGFVAAVVALVVSDDLRKAVLDPHERKRAVRLGAA